MKRQLLILTVISLVGCFSSVFALKSMFLSYIYVPRASGPTDVCTELLLGYTFFPNGEVPELRTASSIPVTIGCRIVSVYPEGDNGFNQAK